MAQTTCLAGIGRTEIATFIAVLRAAGAPLLAMVARLNVVELSQLGPSLLLCDIDDLEVDPLEMLRQLRFVLPPCIIVVYTRNMQRSWSIACHIAGANGLLSKDSSLAELSAGVRGAMETGCYTDPRFEAA